MNLVASSWLWDEAQASSVAFNPFRHVGKAPRTSSVESCRLLLTDEHASTWCLALAPMGRMEAFATCCKRRVFVQPVYTA